MVEIPDADESAYFDQDEWSGVQEALATDQRIGTDSSAGWCVEKLTFLFLTKFDSSEVVRFKNAFKEVSYGNGINDAPEPQDDSDVYSNPVFSRLALSDPVQYQYHLSKNNIKTGDAEAARGNVDAALRSYQWALGTRKELAAGDPHNTQWQRDLAFCYDKVGDVQVAQLERSSALKSYQAALAIRKALAAGDLHNAEWQLDVSVSYWKLAALGTLNSVEIRRSMLQDGLEILSALRTQNRLPEACGSWISSFKNALQSL